MNQCEEDLRLAVHEAICDGRIGHSADQLLLFPSEPKHSVHECFITVAVASLDSLVNVVFEQIHVLHVMGASKRIVWLQNH